MHVCMYAFVINIINLFTYYVCDDYYYLCMIIIIIIIIIIISNSNSNSNDNNNLIH
jgi:hypothetical protein